ncbi:hypothetical protein GPECTOR_37g213 [Gonium pectorale]|uniref:Uncharacterized protein n=1 Tax=Gonium pectorale TaxID=33097 RepID=A0A150GBI5_GONPE|nr:hypothetical protein GPECTOR_37g213 [Gonium pectorale]|eukprot:KXZ47207.1 hypothetical protein GPECTOR_37g213 [Gonium pectorale]
MGGRSRNRYVDMLYNRDALAAEMGGACSVSAHALHTTGGLDSLALGVEEEPGGSEVEAGEEAEADHRTEVFKLTEVDLPDIPAAETETALRPVLAHGEEAADGGAAATYGYPDAATGLDAGAAAAAAAAAAADPWGGPRSPSCAALPPPPSLPLLPPVPSVRRPDTRAFRRALQDLRRSAPAYLMQRLRIPDPREALAAAASQTGAMVPPPGTVSPAAAQRRRRSRNGGAGGTRRTAWPSTRGSAAAGEAAASAAGLAAEDSCMSYESYMSAGSAGGGAGAGAGAGGLGGSGSGLGFASAPATLRWDQGQAAAGLYGGHVHYSYGTDAAGAEAVDPTGTFRSGDAAAASAAATSAAASAAAGAYCTTYGAGFNRYRRWSMFAIDPAAEHPDYWQASCLEFRV